jgi:chemotaxis methyl-accepting protein methylase
VTYAGDAADAIRRPTSLLETDREQVVLLFRANQRDQLLSRRATFAVLESDIIPRLFSSKDATSELRIWVPGCATGD